MSYEKRRRSFGLVSCGVVIACALLVLSMAPHPFALSADKAVEPASDAPPYPVVVSTSPKNGETEVDSKLKSVTVTFDRDMADGMSWTGKIPVDRTRKAAWKDKRTCELPVTLAKGQGYRIGINSKSFQNFRSKSGVPTPSTAIFFVTEGAAADVMLKFAAPNVVSLVPANGAKDVDPATSELKVTFDMPMGAGMSWVGGGESFPGIPDKQKGKWSEDRRTCILPVALKPGHAYSLGLNAPKFNNFQSESGVPAAPVKYTFTTRK